MKRLIAVLTIFTIIFSFAACSSSKDKDLEQQYATIAQQYIENGDYVTAAKALNEGLTKLPDSVILKGLLDSIADKAVEETTKAPVVVTESSIINDFKELRKLYYKWFSDFTFAADKNNVVTLQDYSSQYPVTEPGVETYADFRALFTKYCDDSMLDSYASKSFIKYKDIDGKLYAIEPEIMELGDSTDKDYKVTKISDSKYELVYNEFHSVYGEMEYYQVTVDYILGEDGEWKFCNERRENMGYVDDTGMLDGSGSGSSGGSSGGGNNSSNKGNNNKGGKGDISASEILGEVGGVIDNAVNDLDGIMNKLF